MLRLSRSAVVASLMTAATVTLCSGVALAVWSSTSSTSISSPTGALSTPSLGAVSGVTSSGATINWTDPGSWQSAATYTATATAASHTTRSCNALASALSCALTGLDAGITYSVSVAGQLNNWISSAATTTATPTAADTTPPAVPTSVALANGGGTGNAYINIANKASAQFNVAWASGNAANSSTDTIRVTLTSSGGGTATGTASRGASSPTVVTVDTTSGTLNDGTITATASATDAASNTSATVANTATITRDTTAPVATITFPASSPMTVATYTAGCSTASATDVCGTASDTVGVSSVMTSIQKDSGANACQHGNGSPQDSQYNQSCPSPISVSSFSAGVWTESMPVTSGHSYAITLKVTDLAGNPTQVTFTLAVS